MDDWDDERLEIVDDIHQRYTHCQRCRAPIDEKEGYTQCGDCMDKDPGPSVSKLLQPQHSTCIYGTGTIWLGMPDDPEPECHLSDLPIYKQHPDRNLYTRFPFSSLMKQLHLLGLHTPGSHQYTCFICKGPKHEHVVKAKYTHCQRCCAPIDEKEGYTQCWDCMDKDPGPSVSKFSQPQLVEHSTCMDGNGTIWVGMPDNPEPECFLSDLPIYMSAS